MEADPRMRIDLLKEKIVHKFSSLRGKTAADVSLHLVKGLGGASLSEPLPELDTVEKALASAALPDGMKWTPGDVAQLVVKEDPHRHSNGKRRCM